MRPARSFAAGLAIAAAVAAVAPGAALAHPLGNFTTNQLSQVELSEDDARVTYVLDLAEIPSFQLVQRFDDNGDDALTGAEAEAAKSELYDEVAGGLELTVDGSTARLDAVSEPEISFPPGQGGLHLTRLEASFGAPLPAGGSDVELSNAAFDGRQGWHAIQVLPGEGTDVTSDVAASDPTEGLTVYPEDLLQSPPDVQEASFSVAPGDGAVSAPDGSSGGGEASGDRALDGFANALAGGETEGWLILLLLGAAFGWGALHALSPGHGKAMVAGYLVGANGTPRHALILGATVTITHTAAVFALGLVTLALSQYVLPEDLYPWLGVVSGLMVVAIGFVVMRTRFRRWRSARAGLTHDAAHAHGHEHPRTITHTSTSTSMLMTITTITIIRTITITATATHAATDTTITTRPRTRRSRSRASSRSASPAASCRVRPRS